METKCKTVPARRAGKSKKLTARGQTCLPGLPDKFWYIFWIFKLCINIAKTSASAVGSSENFPSWFFGRLKVDIFDRKLPARSGRQVQKVTCPGRNLSAPGRRLFSTLIVNLWSDRRSVYCNMWDGSSCDSVWRACGITPTTPCFAVILKFWCGTLGSKEAIRCCFKARA